MESDGSSAHYSERAALIIGSLGLTWEDVASKRRILDMGAYDAAVAKAARALGISTEIISLDTNPGNDDPSFVQGNALELPFEAKSFDLVISRAAPPINMVKSMEEVARVIEEARRVLQTPGEFRFSKGGPAILPYSVLPGFDRSTFDFDRADTAEGIHDLQKLTLRLLREIDPMIEQIILKEGKDDQKDYAHYHLLKK